MSPAKLAFDIAAVAALGYLVCGPTAQGGLAQEPVAMFDSLDLPVPEGQARTGHAGGVTRISRSDDGLFYVWAEVNGERVRFLVDTGASVVVLTPRDARRAGVEVDRSRDGMHMRTASGRTRMQWARLDHVRVAGQELRDLDAAVVSDGLKVSLLGQNLLTRLGAVAIDGNQLQLR